MKIYVAGSSKELTRCEYWVMRLREAGFTITEDWVAKMRALGPDKGLSREQLRVAAAADLRGVATADVVWVLAPHADRPSAGCWGELCYALAHRVPIIYSAQSEAHHPQFCIFTALLPEAAEFWEDEKAFAHLLERAAKIAQEREENGDSA